MLFLTFSHKHLNINTPFYDLWDVKLLLFAMILSDPREIRISKIRNAEKMDTEKNLSE